MYASTRTCTTLVRRPLVALSSLERERREAIRDAPAQVSALASRRVDGPHARDDAISAIRNVRDNSLGASASQSALNEAWAKQRQGQRARSGTQPTQSPNSSCPDPRSNAA